METSEVIQYIAESLIRIIGLTGIACLVLHKPKRRRRR